MYWPTDIKLPPYPDNGTLMVIIKIKCPLFAFKHSDTTQRVYNITEHVSDVSLA
jgi:hypothetical protein